MYVIGSESTGATISEGYYLRHSNDFGVTFDAARNLTALFGIPAFGNCAMAASGNHVFLSCTQAVSGNNEIVVARSADNGSTFSSLQNVSLSPIVGSNKSHIAASGSGVYVGWEEGAGSSSEILLARSVDHGVSFAPAANMSATAGFSSIGASLDADGTNVWLTWSDRSPGNDEVFYRRSTNSGETFSDAVNLSSTLLASSTSFVKGNGTQVWVAWSEPPASGSNLPDIYVRGSSDGGFTFGNVVNVSNSGTVHSNQPRVGLTSLAVSLFWGEPASFREVYYSFLELAVPVPPPSLLTLAPGTGMQTQTVDVLLTGTGFQTGAVWQLGGTGTTVSNVECPTNESMRGRITIALTAAPGARNLTVTNPDGQSATLTGAFTVISASGSMLIEITRVDVNAGISSGGFLNGSSAYNSLLAHLENAERALQQQPPDLAAAINQMDAFYIKIGNMAKGKKPEISSALYTTLYNDYAAVMASLGGTAKPPQ